MCGLSLILYSERVFASLSLQKFFMRNAGLEEAQAEIKIAGRNINNLRYADDTTVMAESEEEQKSLLMKVRVEGKSWPEAQHSEKLRSWHPVPSLHGN